jgi:hypothetical protein
MGELTPESPRFRFFYPAMKRIHPALLKSMEVLQLSEAGEEHRGYEEYKLNPKSYLMKITCIATNHLDIARHVITPPNS